ncbi:MAG: pantoate--beta-alanine ligase [Solirubrobacteraceae bacterium]
MRTLRSIAEVRTALKGARRDGRSIGFVPTMGALHEGHLHLIHTARDHHDEVVVSIFVNPTQFNDTADLAAYPRVEAGDAEAAANAGAALLFAPSADEMYPSGFATSVHVGGPSERLEGASRPGHFDGVATVVTKLLNIVGADVAYFGQKDAQQLAVVRQMVADLNIPTKIEAVETVRDVDGLALSSRNARLTGADREQALALSRALRAAQDVVTSANGASASAENVLAAARAEFAAHGIEPDYVELVDPATFIPLPAVNGDALVAVAARVGDVRLIDNLPLTRNGSH